MYRFLLILIVLLPAKLLAETDSKTSTWFMSLTRFSFTEHIRGFLDIQPRLAVRDPASGQDGHFDTLLMRGALGYQVNDSIGLYQGYAVIPTYDPTRVEHRLFQEALLSQGLGDLNSLTHRVRFEQRILEKIDDVALRVRYFGRYTHTLPSLSDRLSLAINEEVFINANDADGGPQAGFNQNRLFLGMNYKLADNLSMDVGYQNQYVEGRNGSNDTVNHIMFLGFISSFSFVE